MPIAEAPLVNDQDTGVGCKPALLQSVIQDGNLQSRHLPQKTLESLGPLLAHGNGQACPPGQKPSLITDLLGQSVGERFGKDDPDRPMLGYGSIAARDQATFQALFSEHLGNSQGAGGFASTPKNEISDRNDMDPGNTLGRAGELCFQTVDPSAHMVKSLQQQKAQTDSKAELGPRTCA